MHDFTHFNNQGKGHMVDVADKNETLRVATAVGKIFVSKNTMNKIETMDMKKGDVISVAQIAGIMGAKKTSDLIPMCHNLNLHGVDLNFNIKQEECFIEIEAIVKTVGKTGVEMEALTAVSVAALTIYDMCKAIDKEMLISDIKLLEKIGGKSGHYKRGE
ncbi:MAG: cyclic pyranopterin monophosphate synthase MoaC [Spirochaetaceae bacterium]